VRYLVARAYGEDMLRIAGAMRTRVTHEAGSTFIEDRECKTKGAEKWAFGAKGTNERPVARLKTPKSSATAVVAGRYFADCWFHQSVLRSGNRSWVIAIGTCRRSGFDKRYWTVLLSSCYYHLVFRVDHGARGAGASAGNLGCDKSSSFRLNSAAPVAGSVSCASDASN
jgi:hypothetical protein